MVNKGTDFFLRCSCKGWERKGVPCRHTWSLLERRPTVGDIAVRFQKHYSYYYLKDPVFTRFYNDAIDNEPIGLQICPDDLQKWPVQPRHHDNGLFYVKSLPVKPPLVTDTNYWLTHSYGILQIEHSHVSRTSQPSFLNQETQLSQESLMLLEDDLLSVDSDTSRENSLYGDECSEPNEGTNDDAGTNDDSGTIDDDGSNECDGNDSVNCSILGQDSNDLHQPRRMDTFDATVMKQCGLTEEEWDAGQGHWKNPLSSTFQTFGSLWRERCEICDDSYHATAVMKKRKAAAMAERMILEGNH